ncbi:MAG: hypothetical protein CSA97_01245 [Bacteroidetes bacterium]|nr:MAG: hypothetical protein CSA97_01245 [Bacteroidota bacterium]
MIEAFVLRNVLSFRDEVVLSFIADEGVGGGASSYCVEAAHGIRLLRLALLFGGNASGKTNVLVALHFLLQFMASSSEGESNNLSKGIALEPFILDEVSREQESRLELYFHPRNSTGGYSRYRYELIFIKEGVLSERLWVYRTSRPSLLYDRGNGEIRFGSALGAIPRAVRDELKVKTLRNMSVLAAYAQVNFANPDLERVVGWAVSYLASSNPHPQSIRDMAQYLWDNKDLIPRLVERMRFADFNISDIRPEVQEVDIEVPLPFDDILNKESEGRGSGAPPVRTIRKRMVRLLFEHEVQVDGELRKRWLNAHMESAGTLGLLNLFLKVAFAFEVHGCILADEIEQSLHPTLLEDFLDHFLYAESDSQLIASTHLDSLLHYVDAIIRRDSIWFTEKDEEGVSDLYSLMVIKGLANISDFRKAYRDGLLGGVAYV